MELIMFFINQIFREASLFLGIIALAGLLLQRKSFSEVIQGTFKTIIGVVILTQGVNIIVNAMLPLSGGFEFLYGIEGDKVLRPMGSDALISNFGSQIGLAMLLAFLINVFVARFTKIKNVFLTGHHLFWFAFIFVAVGVEAGLEGINLILFSTLFLALYIILVPAIIKPYVKKVIGDDSFTLGHPTVILSLVSGFVGSLVGDKSKSTEEIKFSPKLNFLREITITSSLVMFIVYIVVGLLGAKEVYNTDKNLVVYSLMQGILFGAGLTVLLSGVRMMLAEIIPAFKGISDKVIPNAIPALDCPIIFPYAPNAVLIGFIVSMITSVITIILLGTTGFFPYAILPLTITCFFEIGTAAVIGNGTGGVRGAVIGSAVAGVVMIFLVGFSIPFLANTVSDWIVIFGGNDFSLWAIISGLFSRIFV
ncbi:PTS system IIC component, L-Asc family [Anaerobranca californiensis DSM 14826]|jgi:PTS system ascorbate-specific IIC component|uniref:Ascorbate-specific PTS system EIIC component n=1 Tax=Anaerobranca californiensis DSM 14826 TaxID=1120989 RepID=A0A1M6R9P5_9FIRM|nr:PTS ascorbate transporter subunit IIC [Anaerobranca californiensis]SHK29195.1 PTS system IIC component, L-Asc family [Anaerobranca californiensis DSM 14826]